MNTHTPGPRIVNDLPPDANHWVWIAAYAAAHAVSPTRPVSGSKVGAMALAIWKAWKAEARNEEQTR